MEDEATAHALEEALSRLGGVLDQMPAVLGLVRSDGSLSLAGGRDPSEVFDRTTIGEIAAAAKKAVDEHRCVGLDVQGLGSDTPESPGQAGPARFYQAALCVAPAFGPGVVLLLAMDITAKKLTLDQLRRSEALYVDAQGVAHLGTWEWDVSEPTARWSEELYRIYALTPETYTPSYEAYLKMVHPDDRDYVREATERVFKEHAPYSHDERIIRPDGTIRHLHTWSYPILDDGKLVRLVGVCQDITDRKAAENALAERAAELAKTNERLCAEMEQRAKAESRLREVHKLEAIGRLAGGIAHDFNNVLSVVLGRVGLLERALKDQPALRVHVGEIGDAARQAARLTHQLLLFGREQVARPSVIDIGPVLSELAGILRRLIGEDLAFDTSFPEGPLFVAADRTQIEQVLMNLVVNARDAMPNTGTLRIVVAMSEPRSRRERETPLPDELDGERSYVVVTVSDTGVGMDEATRARIFDPYFTTKATGNGLGLSTVYGIVRELGGAVQVESTVGKGTSFSVFFPSGERAQASLPPAAGDTSEGEALRIPRLDPATILLVEDQASVRRLVREQLEQIGYAVVEATSPTDALALGARRADIDLLLTDLVMPEMNGAELARLLKEKVPRLRVVFMSGWAHVLANDLGVGTFVLRKPFTIEHLAKAVEAALREGPLLSMHE